MRSVVESSVLLAALVGAVPRPVRAQTAALVPEVGDGIDALPAVLRVPVAVPSEPGVGLAATAGYGFTESLLGTGDAHHRAAGSLALSARPVRWLALGARFDGRYDAHADASGARDDGWVGDPRLFVRGATRVGESLGLGLHAGLWLPSERAPSAAVNAATLEVEGIVSYAPRRGRLALTLAAGYRVDRSAASAPQADALGPADRLALGLNGFDAVLLGLGAAARIGRLELLAEARWEPLVGAGAPSVAVAPLHARGGVRWQPVADHAFRIGAMLDVAAAARPAVVAGSPLVAVDPRVAAIATLTVALPFAPAPPVDAELEAARRREARWRAAAARRAPQAAPAPPPSAQVAGRVTDASGAPVADARVRLAVAGSTPGALGATPHEAQTDTDGRYRLAEVPPGRYELTVQAAGRAPVRRTIEVAAGGEVDASAALTPALPGGQIRGAVRSFRGDPVRVTVRVEQLELEQTAAEDGTFEIDVAPGQYTVQLSAPGFQPQRRPVRVEQNGVTILNADLRRARRR